MVLSQLSIFVCQALPVQAEPCSSHSVMLLRQVILNLPLFITPATPACSICLPTVPLCHVAMPGYPQPPSLHYPCHTCLQHMFAHCTTLSCCSNHLSFITISYQFLQSVLQFLITLQNVSYVNPYQFSNQFHTPV